MRHSHLPGGAEIFTCDHVIAAKLVDSSFFPQFVLSFPTSELAFAVKLWPLGNKLTTLYRLTRVKLSGGREWSAQTFPRFLQAIVSPHNQAQM